MSRRQFRLALWVMVGSVFVITVITGEAVTSASYSFVVALMGDPYWIVVVSLIAIPGAFLTMSNWPKLQAVVAILSTIVGLFCYTVAACSHWIFLLHSYQISIYLISAQYLSSLLSLGWLFTGIVGFIWAARTRREVADGKE